MSDTALVIIRGTAAGRTFDFEAVTVAISDREAHFVTKSEPQHDVRVQVRHRGSVLGAKPYTTCAFEWDGAYIWFARYEVTDDGTVLIQPDDPDELPFKLRHHHLLKDP